ncbi:hypothetical protein Micbo1qcDRAFT_164647 [Microdochium bolleyi]|uniref:Uncharacterized protein n=1 Tax=Microdochium bolleyi TaxID=196109 RepID=A0A136IYZ1_9PEZI|nr:hypothetical protein Micbo1qcDRAFT_164647 [Microdochium bolleyi]
MTVRTKSIEVTASSSIPLLDPVPGQCPNRSQSLNSSSHGSGRVVAAQCRRCLSEQSIAPIVFMPVATTARPRSELYDNSAERKVLPLSSSRCGVGTLGHVKHRANDIVPFDISKVRSGRGTIGPEGLAMTAVQPRASEEFGGIWSGCNGWDRG